jgi:very-short-patch-repair endonuclease
MTALSPDAGAPTVDGRVAQLASRQCGTLARSQALALGVSDATISRRLRAGRWARAFSGVYVVMAVPPSWRQDVWCAYLGCRPTAVVTHETALRLHGIGGFPAKPITLTVPHGGHARLPGVFVHQIDDLRPHRVVTMAGLPVSTAERALVEVAATTGRRRLGDLVDDVIATKRGRCAGVAACLREVARPGKPGVQKLAQVLDERGDGYVPPQSELERALFAALAMGGLPPPVRQFRLPGRGAIDGLVDAAYTDVRVLIEVDGRRWHTRIRDLKRDHQRDTEAARAGWLTLRFVYEQVVHEPAALCAAVADVRNIRAGGRQDTTGGFSR